MNNGCICCTVRGDLINILEKLSKRKSKLDAIIIECTGLADPGPVAQTFFVDEAVKVSQRHSESQPRTLELYPMLGPPTCHSNLPASTA